MYRRKRRRANIAWLLRNGSASVCRTGDGARAPGGVRFCDARPGFLHDAALADAPLELRVTTIQERALVAPERSGGSPFDGVGVPEPAPRIREVVEAEE